MYGVTVAPVEASSWEWGVSGAAAWSATKAALATFRYATSQFAIRYHSPAPSQADACFEKQNGTHGREADVRERAACNGGYSYQRRPCPSNILYLYFVLGIRLALGAGNATRGSCCKQNLGRLLFQQAGGCTKATKGSSNAEVIARVVCAAPTREPVAFATAAARQLLQLNARLLHRAGCYRNSLFV